jgi:PRTRC genetic system ThiF family protein
VPASTHKIPAALLTRPVRVLVIGCGGNGSAIIAGLPYLHQAMIAAGHPGGLQVTVMDHDTVSAVNCVRQPFSESEIGLFKAVVLVNRINLFWGLGWDAIPAKFTGDTSTENHDIVISCVDTRAARGQIVIALKRRRGNALYWLDLGNDSSTGQFVLGQAPSRKNRCKGRLPLVTELYPEIAKARLDDKSRPSCSAIEALNRQEPFLNPLLANAALALLAHLFRYGFTDHQGGFLNLKTGKMVPITIEGKTSGKSEGGTRLPSRPLSYAP